MQAPPPHSWRNLEELCYCVSNLWFSRTPEDQRDVITDIFRLVGTEVYLSRSLSKGTGFITIYASDDVKHAGECILERVQKSEQKAAH